MKALFVPFAPSLAHVSRCLAVAEAWRVAGHTAVFAVGKEREALVQEAGFETRPVPEVPGAAFRTDQGFRWLTNTYFAENIEAERAILATSKPDIVVYDFRFTPVVSACLAAVPSVSILHGNGLRLAQQPRETARLLVGEPGDVRGAALVRLRLMRCFFPLVFQALMRMIARRFAALLSAHRLPPVNSPFELLVGDEVLITDIPAFLPPELPPRCHVVGPLMWSGWDRPAPWLDELDARPLVYVTMGSTVEAGAVLMKIIHALRDASYNVVVSTGSLSLPSDQVPVHVRVFPTVPGATVVRRCAAVVHHGGHETLMQALAAGVPSLILPSNPDQVLVARSAQAAGVAHSLWRPNGLPLGDRGWNKMTPVQLRHKIDALIADQDCTQICNKLGREIRSYRGAAAAVQILEQMDT